MTIQESILQQLTVAEREHGVKIPIAVESGSRAWGFASPDSDYDCRFIYVRPLHRYLTVWEGRDTIEYTPDAVFDIGGWDLRKVVQHLVKSNAVMLEWLCSPIAYRMDEGVRGALWSLGEAFFRPVSVCWHYLSMARNKLAAIEAAGTAGIKQYCYVLRPLACIRFIHAHGRIPHMEYRRNLDAIAVDGAVRGRIEHLLAEKACAAERAPIAPDECLLRYFREETAWAEAWLAAQHQGHNRDYERADRVFREIVRRVNGDEYR